MRGRAKKKEGTKDAARLRTVVVDAEHARQCHENDAGDQRQELDPGAQDGTQQAFVRREAEDVRVQVFPPLVLLKIVRVQRCIFSIVAGILGEIFVQHAIQDQRDEADEEDDEHRRVDDGQPVDLNRFREKRVVFKVPVFEQQLFVFFPRYTVRKGNLLGCGLIAIHGKLHFLGLFHNVRGHNLQARTRQVAPA